MGDVAIPPAESVDPPAARVGPDFAWWDRSQARTPMPWTAGPGAGFTTAGRGSASAPMSPTRNVAARPRIPNSVLACYRRLLRPRRDCRRSRTARSSSSGPADPDVLAYRRRGSGPDVLVLDRVRRDGADGPRLPVGAGAWTWRPWSRDPPRPSPTDPRVGALGPSRRRAGVGYEARRADRAGPPDRVGARWPCYHASRSQPLDRGDTTCRSNS